MYGAPQTLQSRRDWGHAPPPQEILIFKISKMPFIKNIKFKVKSRHYKFHQFLNYAPSHLRKWRYAPDWTNRESKKIRRQLQRKRHTKIELCVKLSLLRLFYVDHVVQNRRTALSLAWYEWFSCKGEEWKIYCCDPALSSEPQIWKFHVVV